MVRTEVLRVSRSSRENRNGHESKQDFYSRGDARGAFLGASLGLFASIATSSDPIVTTNLVSFFCLAGTWAGSKG